MASMTSISTRTKRNASLIRTAKLRRPGSITKRKTGDISASAGQFRCLPRADVIRATTT